jgi:hypothetical protein
MRDLGEVFVNRAEAHSRSREENMEMPESGMIVGPSRAISGHQHDPGHSSAKPSNFTVVRNNRSPK